MLHFCLGWLSILAGSARFARNPELRASSLKRERGRPLVCNVGLRPVVRPGQWDFNVQKADNAAAVHAALPELSCAQRVVDELLTAAELLNSRGQCVLRPADILTALDDMHLLTESTAPPPDFLPENLLEPRSVDVTALVRDSLPRALATHPIFLRMAEELLDEQFYASVYFGGELREAAPSLSFTQLARRLVASIFVFEQLVAMPHHRRRSLAAYYEAKLVAARAAAASGGAAAPAALVRSVRDTLMGGFLDLKGESVLASINAFEMLHRCGTADPHAGPPAAAEGVSPCAHRLPRDAPSLSRLLNAIMGVNILEAVLSNLSFAFWPDNARAGMALLALNGAPIRPDLGQELDAGWWSLYLAWFAHCCPLPHWLRKYANYCPTPPGGAQMC